ncbi:hypothetical protein [Ruegeria faecimaris]|uniref:Uncharacterized protein n=1 Tax=Ruegeria faecimaris TaxID=686389 RepID=A0A521B9R1_9RHOB|nr:hypothetical protein [Ruegeria faecimaris]SMO43761.1 hypothetical protein SAMN06265380_101677 [Ruegeria faecimaris]
MSTWLAWISAIAALIVAAALIEAYVKRNRKRKLVDMRPNPDEISKVDGIERYGLNPLALAQAEHRRLEKEGWVAAPSQDETTAPDADDKEK